MKKNKAMRIGAALLVVTLLTTCAISNTFAKYVTSESGSDSARVAKWGVQLKVAANDFATSYATDDSSDATGTDLANSVVSSVSTEKLVAPGTDSTEANCQATFSISGTPEVATRVNVELSNVQDVCLKAGTYTDYTNVTGYDTNGDPTYGTFVNSSDYYPVVWTLKQTGNSNALASGTLADIENWLENTYNTTKSMSSYAANQSVAASFTLDWAWSFDDNGAGTYDKQDTYLGNIAAGLASDTNVTLNVGYDLTVTVTQVD